MGIPLVHMVTCHVISTCLENHSVAEGCMSIRIHTCWRRIQLYERLSGQHFQVVPVDRMERCYWLRRDIQLEFADRCLPSSQPTLFLSKLSTNLSHYPQHLRPTSSYLSFCSIPPNGARLRPTRQEAMEKLVAVIPLMPSLKSFHMEYKDKRHIQSGRSLARFISDLRLRSDSFWDLHHSVLFWIRPNRRSGPDYFFHLQLPLPVMFLSHHRPSHRT